MGDRNFSTVKPDFIVTSNGSNGAGSIRVDKLVVGDQLPLTNLELCTSLGSVDISGRVFIRGISQNDERPFALAVNNYGSNPQILITAAPLGYSHMKTCASGGITEWPNRGEIFMSPESSANMNICVRGNTSATPYLTLGNASVPVRIEASNSGDTSTGALDIIGGAMVKKVSNLARATINYGTVANADFCFRTMYHIGGTYPGYYPHLMVYNGATRPYVWAGTSPHLTVKYISTTGFTFLTWNGYNNNTITLGRFNGSESSTDPSDYRHYNTRVFLPNPYGYLDSISPSSNPIALSVRGGVYAGHLSNLAGGVITSRISFGTDNTTENSLRSFFTGTLAASWAHDTATGTPIIAQPINYQKIGREVTVILSENMTDVFTCTAADKTLYSPALLPATFRPSSLITSSFYIVNGASVATAIINVDSNGLVYVNGFDGTNASRFYCSAFTFRSSSTA